MGKYCKINFIKHLDGNNLVSNIAIKIFIYVDTINIFLFVCCYHVADVNWMCKHGPRLPYGFSNCIH